MRVVMSVRLLAGNVAQGRFQRGMALLAGWFQLFSAAAACLEHTRGSYNQRWMWTPIWLTVPMVASSLAAARSEWAARNVLPLASAASLADGLTGFYLHMRGLHRMSGRLRNYAFNGTVGPPSFAPLLFAAAGLLGLAASLLPREEL